MVDHLAKLGVMPNQLSDLCKYVDSLPKHIREQHSYTKAERKTCYICAMTSRPQPTKKSSAEQLSLPNLERKF